MAEITIRSKALARGRCQFDIDGPVELEDGRFRRGDEPGENPLAAALLSLNGVLSLKVDGNTVVVDTDGTVSWEAVEDRIAYGLQMAVAGENGNSAPAGLTEVDEDQLFERLSSFFDHQINPAVAQHGGKVELIDVQEGVLVVRMMGGCQGCGMANVTLKQGIETSVKKIWPDLVAIHDITDHASGENPYYK